MELATSSSRIKEADLDFTGDTGTGSNLGACVVGDSEGEGVSPSDMSAYEYVSKDKPISLKFSLSSCPVPKSRFLMFSVISYLTSFIVCMIYDKAYSEISGGPFTLMLIGNA